MTKYAHFVGRIGGLAAALGAGIALATATPAAVHADTGTETSSTTDSTNTSRASGTSGTKQPADTSRKSETSDTNTTSKHRDSSATPPPDTTDTPSDAPELPSSNTTTEPEADPFTDVDQGIATETTESVSTPTAPTGTPPIPGDATATPSPGAVTAPDRLPSTTKKNPTGNSTSTAAPLVQTTANSDAHTIPQTRALTTAALSPLSANPTTSQRATTAVTTSAALTGTTPQVSTQLSAPPPGASSSTLPPTPISAVAATVDLLLKNIVTAAMDLTGSGAPVDNPLAWAILAWTRRTFLDEPKTAATLTAANATATAMTPTSGARDQLSDIVQFVSIDDPKPDGAVTVRIVAADPLGRPLTYSVLTRPNPASGTVTTESTPGVFAYIPTAAARVSAAHGGPNTDTFIIKIAPTADLNNVLATVEITAPLKPATFTWEDTAPTTWSDTVVSNGRVTLNTDLAGRAVAYREGTKPKYGDVIVNEDTGEWTYTPDIEAVQKAHYDFFGVYLVDTLDRTKPPKDANPNNSTAQYNAAIELDTGKYYEWKDWDGDGINKWKEQVGGPTRTDTFTITAYDPTNPSIVYDSVPITTNFARLGFHLTGKSLEGDVEKSPPRLYIWPKGYQWTVSAKPGEFGGTLSIVDPTTGEWTYTASDKAKALGEDTITITATGTDHSVTCPNDGWCELTAKIKVYTDGTWSLIDYEGKARSLSDAVLDQAFVGNSTRGPAGPGASGYKIGTGSTPPGGPPGGPAPAPGGGSGGGAAPPVLPVVRSWWSDPLPTAVPVAVAGTCAYVVDGIPQDSDAALQGGVVDLCTDQPVVSSPDNPHAGSTPVTAAAPDGSIDAPNLFGWQENIAREPITTDKYTVQEGDTLSGIAQRWGLGDDRTENYQVLAQANQDVIGNNPNMIHPGQVLTRPT